MTFNECIEMHDTTTLTSAQPASPETAVPTQRQDIETLHTVTATSTFVDSGNMHPPEEQMQRHQNQYYLAQHQCYADLEAFAHSQQMSGALRAKQIECYADLEAFAHSQQMSGALRAKQIEEETLQSIVGNLTAAGALVVYSGPNDDYAGSSSDENTLTGLAVFVEHAVLKYVLYFPPNSAAYNLYLNGDRTLGSVTNEGTSKLGMSSHMADNPASSLAVLDAVQVVTRVSRPMSRSPLATRVNVMPAYQTPISSLSAPRLGQSTSTPNTQDYTVVKRFNSAVGAGSTMEL
jgi:hypothetical protein